MGHQSEKIVYNFSAGPCVLPKEVLKQAQDECLSWQGTGVSVMEMSHRSKDFIKLLLRLRRISGIGSECTQQL